MKSQTGNTHILFPLRKKRITKATYNKSKCKNSPFLISTTNILIVRAILRKITKTIQRNQSNPLLVNITTKLATIRLWFKILKALIVKIMKLI